MLMILPIDYLGYIIKFLSRKLTIINGRSFPKDCLGEVRKPSGDAVTCEFLAYKKNWEIHHFTSQKNEGIKLIFIRLQYQGPRVPL